MQESRAYGFVRGTLSNERPYRDLPRLCAGELGRLSVQRADDPRDALFDQLPRHQGGSSLLRHG